MGVSSILEIFPYEYHSDAAALIDPISELAYLPIVLNR